MSPIDVPTALRRARRGRFVSRLTRFGLFAGYAAGFVLAQGKFMPFGVGILFATMTAVFASGVRGQRMMHGVLRAAALIDNGEPAEADRMLSAVLRSASPVARAWIPALRLLAMARAALGVPQDARTLASEVLRSKGGTKAELDTMRLLVAGGALAANDMPAAHAALEALQPPLALPLSLRNLELQTDYCLRVGAYQHAAADLPTKVELAELMPADAAAGVQAMLAFAAARLGRPDWSAWLARRAALLTDTAKLVRTRPILQDVFTADRPA